MRERLRNSGNISNHQSRHNQLHSNFRHSSWSRILSKSNWIQTWTIHRLSQWIKCHTRSLLSAIRRWTAHLYRQTNGLFEHSTGTIMILANYNIEFPDNIAPEISFSAKQFVLTMSNEINIKFTPREIKRRLTRENPCSASTPSLDWIACWAAATLRRDQNRREFRRDRFWLVNISCKFSFRSIVRSGSW